MAKKITKNFILGKDIVARRGAITTLSELNVSGKLIMRVTKSVKPFIDELKAFDTLYENKITDLGTEDSNGKISIDRNSPNGIEFVKYFNEVSKSEGDITFSPIDYSLLLNEKDIELSTDDIDSLLKLGIISDNSEDRPNPDTTIKVKYLDVQKVGDSIMKLVFTKFPIQVANEVYLACLDVLGILNEIDVENERLLELYGEPQQNGQLGIKVDSEEFKSYNEEIGKLNDTTAEISKGLLDFSTIESSKNLKLSSTDIVNLISIGVIKDEDDEETSEDCKKDVSEEK